MIVSWPWGGELNPLHNPFLANVLPNLPPTSEEEKWKEQLGFQKCKFSQNANSPEEEAGDTSGGGLLTEWRKETLHALWER